MQIPVPATSRLSVSLVLFHTPLEMLEKTLTSLSLAVSTAGEPTLALRVPVTLVDNSCDAAYRAAIGALIARYENDAGLLLRYSPQPVNRGYGAGHNVALSGLQSDVHLILNPDVELEAGSLQAGLTRLRESADVALLSPRVAGADGRQQLLCKRYPSVAVLLLRAFAPGFVQRRFRERLAWYEMADLCRGEQEVDVPLATGCCMLVTTRALQAVGGFDERYFLYFEDFDLSLRLQSQGRLVFYPAMRIVHHGGFAARKGVRHIRYFIGSGVRFFNAHGWRWI